MGGGGGAPQRKPNKEWKSILDFEQKQIGEFGNYFAGQPLLQQSQSAALAGLADIPGLQHQISGFQSELGGLLPGLDRISSGLTGDIGRLGHLIPGLRGDENNLTSLRRSLERFSSQAQQEEGPLKDIIHAVDPIIKSRGALTAPMERDVAQATRAQFAASGNVTGNQALGAELLNRNAFQQQRFDTAQQEAQGATQGLASLTGLRSNIAGEEANIVGQQSGIRGLMSQIFGQQAGIRGQQAGITGLKSGIVGQEAGLTGELQNIVSRAIQPALSTQQTAVGTFSQIADPLIGYLSNLFQGNQQAQVAAQQASQGKSSGIAGGAISAVGSILPLLFSDERVKEKIRDTGKTTASGIPIKTFQYATDAFKRRYLGFMAQDVEKRDPDHVFTDPLSGLKAVTTKYAPRSISAYA